MEKEKKNLLAYKYRIYPTPEQKQFIEHTFGCCRKIYNLCVAQALEAHKIRSAERDEWIKGGKIGKPEYSAPFPGNKFCFTAGTDFQIASYFRKAITDENGYAYMTEVDSTALNYAAMQVSEAYSRHINNKEIFGLPSFKKKNGKNSFTSCRAVNANHDKYDLLTGNLLFDVAHESESGHIYPAILLPKFSKVWKNTNSAPGWIRVKMHRDFRIEGNPCCISRVTVSKDCRDQYYISMLVNYQNPIPVIKSEKQPEIGIDFGIQTLATTSDGTEYNLKCRKKLRRIENHIQKLQAEKAKCTKVVVDGRERVSQNYRKLARKISKLKGKQTRIREYELDCLSKELVTSYDNVYVSGIDISDLKQETHASSPELTNSVAHKINYKASENGIGSLRQKISYKSEMYGTRYIAIKDDAPVTKTCSICGKLHFEEIEEGVPVWICEHCGAELRTKQNAARNILSRGRAIENVAEYNAAKLEAKKGKRRSAQTTRGHIYDLIKEYNESHSEEEKIIISDKKIKGLALASAGEMNAYSDEELIAKIKELIDAQKTRRKS